MAAGGLNVGNALKSVAISLRRRGERAYGGFYQLPADTTWRSRKIDTTPAAARLTMPVTAAPRSSLTAQQQDGQAIRRPTPR